MIVKELQPSIRLRKLEALLRRLPSHHRERRRVEDEYARRMAGYRGEQSVAYHLTPLLSKEFLVLYDIRMQQNSSFYQMDIQILTPAFFVILEVKNMSGTLCFDQPFGQLIRTLNGKEEAFSCPIVQVKRQAHYLESWAKLYRIPVHSFVVISNPATIIKSIPAYSDIVVKTVIHAAALEEKITSLRTRYREPLIAPKELIKLSKKLKNLHVPDNPDLLSIFQIRRDELLTGVHCPSCSAIPMRKISGMWSCSKCGCRTKTAHLHALDDYVLLLGTSITNRQVRDFLQVPSTFSASKLLASLNLPHTGTYRNRAYLLPAPT